MGCMLVVAVFVGSLCACYRQSVLTVVADPTIGHPCPEEGGLCVRVRCTGGEAPYVLDFGDGTEAFSRSGIAEHVYRPPFHQNEYRITASCEAGSGSTTVSIENRPPVFYDIFTVKGGRAAEREMVILQVNYLAKGCPDCPDSCDPYRIFGGLDPDGDVLYYEWHIRKQGAAQEDSVYDLAGNRVNGMVVPGDHFVWFPMWRESSPLFPLGSTSAAGVGNGEIARDPGQASAPGSVAPKGQYYPYTIRLVVRDFCGAEDTYEATWEILELDR